MFSLSLSLSKIISRLNGVLHNGQVSLIFQVQTHYDLPSQPCFVVSHYLLKSYVLYCTNAWSLAYFPFFIFLEKDLHLLFCKLELVYLPGTRWLAYLFVIDRIQLSPFMDELHPQFLLWFFFFLIILKALIALKKGSQLIKYSRKGKPKVRQFRLSSVSYSFLQGFRVIWFKWWSLFKYMPFKKLGLWRSPLYYFYFFWLSWF